jgi:hypothetical protein
MAFIESGIPRLAMIMGCLVFSPSVAAQSGPEPDAVSQPKEVAVSDLSVRGQLGGFSDPGNTGGLLVGATALYRLGPVAAGGQFEGGAALFDYGFTGVGALGGIALRPSNWSRVELLGTVGHHSYSGVGRGFLSADPGVRGDSAYAGVRAGASYLFGAKPTHLELGVYGGVDDDLSRETRTSRYTSTTWFSGEASEQESQHVVGTQKYSLVLALGMTHDVW